MSMDMKHSVPEVKDYLEAVRQEIKEKEIQESLISELYQHIEDSAAHQAANGMPEENAWRYALASMGDASEIGRELNRVHQKRNPALSIFIAGISFLIAIFLSTPHLRMLQNNIFYRVYAGTIILLLTYFGNLILKKHRLIYTIFASVWGIYSFSYLFPSFAERFLSNTDVLFPCYFFISHSHSVLFASSLLTILILSYCEANADTHSHFYSIFIFAAISWLSKLFLGKSSLTAAFILTAGFASIVLYSKSNNWKIKCIKLCSIISIFCLIQLPNICSLFTTPSNDNLLIVNSLKEARLFGKAYVLEDLVSILPKYYYTDYHITYWFLTYGILPACIILIIVFSMYVALYLTIQKIGNSSHRLLAEGCFICLFLQFILYFLGNIGLPVIVFPCLPLISEGISSITANAIFIGTILTLYRYDRVLAII